MVARKHQFPDEVPSRVATLVKVVRGQIVAEIRLSRRQRREMERRAARQHRVPVRILDYRPQRAWGTSFAVPSAALERARCDAAHGDLHRPADPAPSSMVARLFGWVECLGLGSDALGDALDDLRLEFAHRRVELGDSWNLLLQFRARAAGLALQHWWALGVHWVNAHAAALINRAIRATRGS